MSRSATLGNGSDVLSDRQTRNKLALVLFVIAVVAAAVTTWGQSVREIISHLF